MMLVKLRYVEDVNDAGEKVTIEVAHKQVHYMPITPRLKRMFLSERTTIHMQWHKDGKRENKEVMVHPSDLNACKALYHFDIEFARDTRNVCILLVTGGFTPFDGNTTSYSLLHHKM
jgi:hypothetical protein